MANNNNINNIITTNKNKLQIAGEQSVIHLDSVKEEAEPTKADKISHCHQDLPKDWQWTKLDLFNNINDNLEHLRLNITICKNKQLKRYRALMNTEWAHFKRNLTAAEWSSPHYELVKKTRQELKNAGYRVRDIKASKCYMPGYRQGKGDTVKRLSVLLVPETQDHKYSAILIHKEQKILVGLRGDTGYLSSNQRNRNQIATGTANTILKTAKGVDIDDVL
ncbi:MAG: hypothetical protein VW270_10545 [Candidatus Poseidoniales archaeon]